MKKLLLGHRKKNAKNKLHTGNYGKKASTKDIHVEGRMIFRLYHTERKRRKANKNLHQDTERKTGKKKTQKKERKKANYKQHKIHYIIQKKQTTTCIQYIEGRKEKSNQQRTQTSKKKRRLYNINNM